MKNVVLVLVIICISFFAGWMIKPEHIVNNEIVKVDTITTVDTVIFARYNTVTKTITDTIIKPVKVVKIDTQFVFDEIKTYRDSIIDSFFKFKYEMDIIGEPLNINYSFTHSKEVITQNYNILSLNALVGRSILINLFYTSHSSDFSYGLASDILRKEYYFSIGYNFKF